MLGLAALAAGPAGASYSDAELCSPGFALERLARSDMKTLIDTADATATGGDILARVYERWGVLGHYLKARDAVADSTEGVGAADIDAAVRDALRRACDDASG
ncbi:hypothetical protein [Rhodovulum sp. 12E13]|uniref:hypothetical protein n=1 Tax=Rhodovulum sp. 12E13 TaxID=2203891 RepID=UPI0011C0798F|nr:hypothetical protein [Rhodovulum sp. 12E13]